MDTADIIKKVRKVEIRSKGLSNHFFSGAYHTAFKGRGMSFSEVRAYAPGDDVRTIDWNVTARSRSPYVKVFHEERELTVMLMIDISASSYFGTFHQQKIQVMAEIAAVIAFSAQNNNDKIGVLFFSDKVEKYIPPKKGKSHVLRIIREILAIQPSTHTSTNFDASLEHFSRFNKKRTITFLMSDFVGTITSKALSIAAKKHDLVGIQLYDEAEFQIPDVGLIRMKDSETGKQVWIDTHKASERAKIHQSFHQNQAYIHDIFKKSNADFLSLQVKDDYVKMLQSFFSTRVNAR